MISLDVASRMISFISGKKRIDRNLVEIVQEAAFNGVGAYEFSWYGNEDLDTLETIQKNSGIICTGFRLPSRVVNLVSSSEKEIVATMMPQIETTRLLNASSVFVYLGYDSNYNYNSQRVLNIITTMGLICSDAGIRLCLFPIPMDRPEESWESRQYQWSRVRCPMDASAELISNVNCPAITMVYRLSLFDSAYHNDHDWSNYPLRLNEQDVERYLVPDLTKHRSIIGHIQLTLVSDPGFIGSGRRLTIFDEILTAVIEQAPIFRGIGSVIPGIHIGLRFVWPNN